MKQENSYAQPRDKSFEDIFGGRIRVAHIITKLELGGAQLNTLYTVENLNREYFDVYLITGDEGYLVPRAKAFKNVKCYFISEMKRAISPLRDFRALLKIRKILKEIKPHIVHTHCSKAGILGRWAAFFAGVPIIIHTIHGFAFSRYIPWLKNTIYKFIERITAPITTKFIAVARTNVEEGMHAGLFEEKDTEVIRSGVDIKRFAEARVDRDKKLAEFGINKGAQVVAMFACFKPQKAPIDFIRVAHYVHRHMPDVRFLLVGDGELRPAIETAITERGLEGVVMLPGWREDVPEIMKSIDVMALTSLWEGLPQVFPQAMAAGAPIVASDVDGADEAINDNVNGFLIPPREISRFASAVLLLLQDDELRRNMGEAGKRYVKDFEQELMVQKQEEFYITLGLKYIAKERKAEKGSEDETYSH